MTMNNGSHVDYSLSPRTGIYNEGVRVVREAPKRFAVYAKGERLGRFQLLRDALTFALDVREGRAFFSDAGPRLVQR